MRRSIHSDNVGSSGSGRRTLLLDQQPRLVPPENGARVEVHVDRRFRLGDSCRGEARARPRQRLEERQLTVVASLSFSAL